MKKINLLIRDETVQGNLLIVAIFAMVLTLTLLTWGK